MSRPPSGRARGRTGLGSLPLSPWAGLGVLASWAAAALLAGGMRLRLRDA
jgi:ABC-2 type transport system permease protein